MARHDKPIEEVESRGRSRWRVRASHTHKGKRVRVCKTFDSRAEAETFYAQARLGDLTARSRDSFDDWADRWLALKEDEGIRANTLDGYRTDLKHPRSAFGDLRIQDVNEDQVLKLVRSMRDARLSKRTTAKMLTTLRAVFRLALKKHVIRLDPAEDVKALGRHPKQRDALTVEELTKVRQAVAGDPHEAAWLLTLAGLRRSELLALTWADVDLESGLLTISKGRVALGGVQPPKTARGRRQLPLDEERLRLLRALRSWHAEVYGLAHARTGYVVVNELGRPMRPEDWTARWRALCQATDGVRDDHTLHAARHSTVTFMRNAGVADHVVADWHGHEEVVMRRTYSHAHVEQLKSAGSALTFGT